MSKPKLTRKRIEGEKLQCEARKMKIVDVCMNRGDLQWHHLEYLSDGGSDDDSNIVCVCAGCHSRIHSANGDWVEFGQKGGLRTLELYGTEHFQRLAFQRWAKLA